MLCLNHQLTTPCHLCHPLTSLVSFMARQPSWWMTPVNAGFVCRICVRQCFCLPSQIVRWGAVSDCDRQTWCLHWHSVTDGPACWASAARATLANQSGTANPQLHYFPSAFAPKACTQTHTNCTHYFFQCQNRLCRAPFFGVWNRAVDPALPTYHQDDAGRYWEVTCQSQAEDESINQMTSEHARHHRHS